MAMIVSNKQRIYFSIEGERGPFVLLHHGLLGCHEDWYEWGYVRALAGEFRLVIPDARGHGRSDKPQDKAQYGLENFADDMIELLNFLDIRNINILGYSLGALVGFDLLNRFPGRVRSALLGGEAPLMTDAFAEQLGAMLEKFDQEPPGATAATMAQNIPTVFGQGALAEDPALQPPREMLEAMIQWPLPQAEQFFPRTPLALFTGREDPARPRIEQAGSRLSRSRLIVLNSAQTAEALAECGALAEEARSIFQAGRENRGEPVGAGSESRRPGRASRPESGTQNEGDDSAPGVTQGIEETGQGAATREESESPDGVDADLPGSPSTSGELSQAQPSQEAGVNQSASMPTPAVQEMEDSTVETSPAESKNSALQETEGGEEPVPEPVRDQESEKMEGEEDHQARDGAQSGEPPAGPSADGEDHSSPPDSTAEEDSGEKDSGKDDQ